ncbi:hypothetical protein [Flavobacterium akiainvivens]|uniref:hypothetical protein n=1 Tax=Flavobacterium akiainvivens TaxID=1202724 RepID=UPI0008DF2896|nr:hypothetical protein [Flavobacterium akiainvivens]SFQ77849.1 hypothetical protein SAMN05444144_12715 [Flavobacterium akiainvivens]
MKKVILALSLLAVLSTTLVSCSTDDSALEQSADTLSDNGGAGALPKPQPRP